MDKQPENQAYEVPLHERLDAVPLDARLIIEEKKGLGTSLIPIGSLANKTAAELRRLYTLNQELVEVLDFVMFAHGEQRELAFEQALALIAKHKEQA